MSANLPFGCTQAEIDRIFGGEDEDEADIATEEEDAAEAWEYWHQRAHKLETVLRRLMDCSRAIVGGDENDERAAEAFDMFWEAHREARAVIATGQRDGS